MCVLVTRTDITRYIRLYFFCVLGKVLVMSNSKEISLLRQQWEKDMPQVSSQGDLKQIIRRRLARNGSGMSELEREIVMDSRIDDLLDEPRGVRSLNAQALYAGIDTRWTACSGGSPN